MEFLRTAAYKCCLRPITLDTDFTTTCTKIPGYSGELTKQMADRLIAQHYFHGVLVHRVVKLMFSNSFSPIDVFHPFWYTWYPHTADAKANIFMLSGYQAIVLHSSPALYFHSNFIVFISIVGFNNEDNCCQSEGIGKSIKKNALKGILRVDWLINVAANTTSFFYECFFGSFFSKIMPESWGCGLYTSVYSNLSTSWICWSHL